MEIAVPQVFLLGKTYLADNENFYIRNDAIVHMAAGDRHTIIVTESGRVYAFGDNNSGQLGLGHMDAVERVSCIKSLKFGETGEKIILAACGRESSLVATNRGSLYAFGLNHCCQLGMESEESVTIHFSPIKIESFRSKMSWKQLAMGAEHTCVLTNDGHVYVWGSNEVGQCGLERKYEMIRVPSQLRLEYPVNAISCGYYHTALISEDGRLFLFGNNSDGQLGRSIPDGSMEPLEISLPDPIHSVACGNEYTVALTDKGDVYTCGKGDQGQLGLGRKVSMIKHFQMIEHLPSHLTAISAGSMHTAILDSSGGIYLFGDNRYDQLNQRAHSNQFTPFYSDQFKKYHILNVACGGCQTIIFAQRKSMENLVEKPRKDSIDKALICDRRLNRINNLKMKVQFNKELSLSDERTVSISESEEIHKKDSFGDNHSQDNYYTSSSTTTSGRTSSSISSQDDNPMVAHELTDRIQHNFHSSSTNKTLGKPYVIDSKDEANSTESKPGLLFRIFNRRSSQKLSIATNENSKTCLLM